MQNAQPMTNQSPPTQPSPTGPDEAAMHAIYTAFAAIPWLWVGLFALFVGVGAASQGGALPSYGSPDPKSLTGIAWLQVPFYLLMMMGIGSMPVWLAFTAWRQNAIPHTRERRVTLLAYIIGMALMLSVLFFDPLGLMTWFVD